MGDHLNFVSLKSKSFTVLTFWIFFFEILVKGLVS